MHGLRPISAQLAGFTARIVRIITVRLTPMGDPVKRIIALLALLSLSANSLAEIRVAVLGVGENMDLMQRWSGAMNATVSETAQSWSFRASDSSLVVRAPKPGTAIPVVANTVYQSDVSLIVLDTTQGPLPHNREHIIVSRQARVPVVAIMMANVDELFSLAPKDARELLRLEEEEIREVMRLYEVGGAATVLLHDSSSPARAPRSADGGLKSAGQVLSQADEPGNSRATMGQQRGAKAELYLLADAEAGGKGATIAQTATLQVWSEGSAATAEISMQGRIGPGDFGSVDIRTSEPITGGAGSRILLFDRNRVVGIGVLTAVGSF